MKTQALTVIILLITARTRSGVRIGRSGRAPIGTGLPGNWPAAGMAAGRPAACLEDRRDLAEVTAPRPLPQGGSSA